MFYDEMYRVCTEKGTKPTAVLMELDMSTGNISKWKKGTSPTVDVATRIAEHLGVSLSYLCNPSDIVEKKYPAEYAEWIEVIDRIPDDKKMICLEFLKTHMAVPDKFLDKKKA